MRFIKLTRAYDRVVVSINTDRIAAFHESKAPDSSDTLTAVFCDGGAFEVTETPEQVAALLFPQGDD